RLREEARLRVSRDLGGRRRRSPRSRPQARRDGPSRTGGGGIGAMNIGVCGGTFDPFHRGHLEPVLAIRDAMAWDRVMYIPAWQQPFKTDRPATSGYHR